jgi:hemerythrin-like domain-containing protein
MDEKLLEAHKAFRKALAALNQTDSLEAFESTDEYHQIRAYLNIHELVAVGIHHDVLDENVCFDFWADELLSAYRDASKLIAFIQTQATGRHSYSDLKRLYKSWNFRDRWPKIFRLIRWLRR